MNNNPDTIGIVKNIFCYPIKGLSSVPFNQIELTAGQGIPGDRLFGFAKQNSGFDPTHPKPLPKDRFLVLAQHAKLAALKTNFIAETQEFSASIDGKDVIRTDLKTSEGLLATTNFLADFLQLTDEERPFFASAYPHRFTDVSVVSETMMNAVSIINLASVRDFEARIGQTVDPSRFRGNILVDGLPPFSELGLVGQTIQIGNVDFKVLLRTKRCPATEVNPNSAERDIFVPALLRKKYGHFDMGVYAGVISDGTISLSDEVKVKPD